MEFDLNEIVLLGGAGFLVGLLLLGVTWSISATIGRKKMNRTKEEKQKVMMGLDRSCEGIESVISSVDLGSMDLMQFRSELVRRVNALHSRLEQFADGLEQYFTQYIMLRIENYAQIIDKIDDLGATVGKYGNPQGALIQEEDSVDLSDAGAAAPVAEAPPAAPVPVDEPAFVEAEQPQAPQPQQPQAPAEPQLQQVDDDEEEIMTFDIPTQSDQGGGLDLSSAPTLEMPMPSLEEQEQPAQAPQAPPPPPPQQQQAPAQAGMGEDRSLSDDDLMYGQTMQFSMQDIEAARRGEQPPQPQPQQPQQAQQLPDAGELGETFVFASDDGTGQQQPPAPPPPQQPKPVQEQSRKKEDGQIISGDDLMQQMDSFFNFGD